MYPDEPSWEALFEAFDTGSDLPWPEMQFHLQEQDTSLPGWQALLKLIEQSSKDQREVFAPKADLGPELWSQVLTLPASIGSLKCVKKLDLYGSNLIRIPPEIGDMEGLQEFIPYTSYGLHWFPYEITRCHQLTASTVSTRALYGNYKYRPPFPSLSSPITMLVSGRCSVCDKQFNPIHVEQVWISLGVGSDVLPLLVNACSKDCISKLPEPSNDYIQLHHKGGLSLQQPDAEGL
jgi:hypothetical protein